MDYNYLMLKMVYERSSKLIIIINKKKITQIAIFRLSRTKTILWVVSIYDDVPNMILLLMGIIKNVLQFITTQKWILFMFLEFFCHFSS
jgi:hypothetical protein